MPIRCKAEPETNNKNMLPCSLRVHSSQSQVQPLFSIDNDTQAWLKTQFSVVWNKAQNVMRLAQAQECQNTAAHAVLMQDKNDMITGLRC